MNANKVEAPNSLAFDIAINALKSTATESDALGTSNPIPPRSIVPDPDKRDSVKPVLPKASLPDPDARGPSTRVLPHASLPEPEAAGSSKLADPAPKSGNSDSAARSSSTAALPKSGLSAPDGRSSSSSVPKSGAPTTDAFSSLKPVQQQAVLLLAAGTSAAEVARRVGKTKVTIGDWLKDQVFAAALRKQRDKFIARLDSDLTEASQRDLRLVKKAWAVLEASMDDPDARVNAAKTVLAHLDRRGVRSSFSETLDRIPDEDGDD